MHVLIIESNTTGTGAIAVARVRSSGGRVTFATRRPGLYPFLDSLTSPPHAPPVAIAGVETNDAAVLEAFAVERHAADPFTAVLTFSTFYVEGAARVARRLGLPALDPDVARLCHDKAAFRRHQRDAHLPSPPWRLVGGDLERAVCAADEIGFPCVVKPTGESGSDGVRLVRTRDELIAHVRAVTAATRNARDQPRRGEALIEGLLAGPEFSVETFTLEPGRTHVMAVTRKHVSEPPWFVELGHDVPAAAAPDTLRALRDEAVRALEAVSYDFGAAHTELRLTAAGPVVVEINPRLAGGMIPELIRLATGVDPIDVLLAAAAGLPVGERLRPTRAESASIRFITTQISGRLHLLPDMERIQTRSLVRAAVIEARPGMDVRPPAGARDRLGYVIASGPDGAAVGHAADQARDAAAPGVEPAAARIDTAGTAAVSFVPATG